jgi:hypothetical protein
MDIPMDDLKEKLKVAAAANPKIAELDPKTLVDTSLLDELASSGFIQSIKK